MYKALHRKLMIENYVFICVFVNFCFVMIFDMPLISGGCKNDHIIFNVGTRV